MRLLFIVKIMMINEKCRRFNYYCVFIEILVGTRNIVIVNISMK